MAATSDRRDMSHAVPRPLRAAALGICVGLVASTSCHDASEIKVSDAPPAASAPVADKLPSGEALVRERLKRDRTVYAAEIQAQRYENTIVQLWDDLLQGDAFEVLRKFPFDELLLGDFATGELYAAGVEGIRRARMTGPSVSISHDDYRRRLDVLEAASWKVVQTEWHHAAFHPPSSGQLARSVVSFEIHAAHAERQQRLILRGKLDITWSDRFDDRGHAVAAKIVANDVQRLEHTGPLPFETMVVIDPRQITRSSRAHPVILYDLDGDGLSEVILGGCNLVFRNRGGGQFVREQLTKYRKDLAGTGLIADFTGDGNADLLAVLVEGHRLCVYEGNRDGRFLSPARLSFDRSIEHPQVMTAGDIDADGDLDLFIAQYKPAYESGQMPTPFFDANDGHPAFLLRNDGRGKFTDITEAAGLAAKRHRRTYSASLVDLDDDRDLDLIVVSDFAGLDVYLNDGRGGFRDVTRQWVDKPHAFGMSHVIADFNADGRLDLYMLGMGSTTARRLEQLGLGLPGRDDVTSMRPAMGYGNRMYLAGVNSLRQAPRNDLVARTGWSWGSTASDFDNDGDVDLYIANGHISGKSTRDYCTRFWCHDIYERTPQPDQQIFEVFKNEMRATGTYQTSWNGHEHNVLFLNRSGGEFLNVAFLLGTAFEFDSRAVVSDDLDGDGRRDLLVIQYDGRQRAESHILHVIRNKLTPVGNWIGVRLREQPGGPSPIGAKITVRAGGRDRVATIVTGDSFSAQHAPTAHFGLGEVDKVEAIEVRWVDGTLQRLSEPKLNSYHFISSREQP